MGKAGKAAPTRRTGYKRAVWTTALKDRFLDHLAATCNVRAAAAAAGVSTCTVYNRRRSDEAFATEWRTAIAQAYEIIETHLIGMALSGANEIDTGLDGSGAVLNRDMAVQLLTAQRKPLAEQRKRAGARPRTLTPEQVETALLAKLARLLPGPEERS